MLESLSTGWTMRRFPSHDLPEELPEEIARFEAALIATRAELLEIQQRIADAIGTKDASIFDAHLLVVEDRTLIDEVLRNLENERHNVEYTFHQVAEKYCRTLGAIDDPYLRERVVDIEDVARRVIRHLLGKAPRTIASEDKPHIIVARNLTPPIQPPSTAHLSSALRPSKEQDFPRRHHGTLHEHPGHRRSPRDLRADCPAAMTSSSMATRAPSSSIPALETLQEYGRIELRKEEVAERLGLIRDTASTTSDGRHIILSANIELPEELDDVSTSGAEGVGLYRTEFLYLNRTSPRMKRSNLRIIASLPSARNPIPSSSAHSTSVGTSRRRASNWIRSKIPFSVAGDPLLPATSRYLQTPASRDSARRHDRQRAHHVSYDLRDRRIAPRQCHSSKNAAANWNKKERPSSRTSKWAS